ncbi:MAG TPA: DNA polymerase IV [Solirubrobacteraceae bacterium]|nr:DNA polymerase IV [Solirubrobacteraceae bacterium]
MPAESSELSTAHVDCDAFYVSIELRRRPELRGRPVVVAGSGPRAVVTTASYEARRYGVGSAMPAARARRLCPQAVFLPPDFATYREASREVMDIVRAHVDRVEIVGLDEAYLDLSELFSPRAAMRRLVAEIEAATRLTCSVGIGPNKLVAKVASDAEKPAGFVVLTREQACARFAQAPPALVPGIGPKTAARLAELGLTTLGALAAAPERMLIGRFGPNLGVELGRRARFEHDGVVGAARKVASESRERTFDRDVEDPARLRDALERMADELCSSLAAHGRRGRTIGIKVRLDDFTTVTRAHTIEQPTSDVERVTAVALRLLDRYAPPRPVRLLGVRIAGLTAATSAAPEPPATGPRGRPDELDGARHSFDRRGGVAAARPTPNQLSLLL